VAEQEAFGGLDVVAALYSYAGCQQARVDLSRRAPDPASDLRTRSDCSCQVGLVDDVARRPAVRVQGNKQCPTALGERDCPSLVHAEILAPATDSPWGDGGKSGGGGGGHFHEKQLISVRVSS
jgi:hypothetical protein